MLLKRRLYMLTMGALLANAAVAQFWTSEKPAYLRSGSATCADCNKASAELAGNPIALDDQDSFKELQAIIGKDLSKEMNGFSRPDISGTFPQTIQSMIPEKKEPVASVIPAEGFKPMFLTDPSYKPSAYPPLSNSLTQKLQEYYKNELPLARPGSLPSYFGNNYGPNLWNNNSFRSSAASVMGGIPSSSNFAPVSMLSRSVPGVSTQGNWTEFEKFIKLGAAELL